MGRMRDDTDKKAQQVDDFRKGLADTLEYQDYLKSVAKDQEDREKQAHQKYIANEKNKQDKDRDKYYQFYRDFDKRMNDNLKSYEHFQKPQLEKMAREEQKIDQDREKYEAEQQRDLANREQKRQRDQFGAEKVNQGLRKTLEDKNKQAILADQRDR